MRRDRAEIQRRITNKKTASGGLFVRISGFLSAYTGDSFGKEDGKMRKNLMRWEIAGALFVCAAGTVLHFVYRWIGESVIAAAVAAVNESTWEHMKLFFIPYFIVTMVQFTVFAEPLRNFFACKAACALVGLAAIPVLFYTLNGAFGETGAWMNVAIFYIVVALIYLLSFFLLTGGALRGGGEQVIGFAVLWLLLFVFVYFTYRTPLLPIFRDPATGCYGIGRCC